MKPIDSAIKNRFKMPKIKITVVLDSGDDMTFFYYKTIKEAQNKFVKKLTSYEKQYKRKKKNSLG